MKSGKEWRDAGLALWFSNMFLHNFLMAKCVQEMLGRCVSTFILCWCCVNDSGISVCTGFMWIWEVFMEGGFDLHWKPKHLGLVILVGPSQLSRFCDFSSRWLFTFPLIRCVGHPWAKWPQTGPTQHRIPDIPQENLWHLPAQALQWVN